MKAQKSYYVSATAIVAETRLTKPQAGQELIVLQLYNCINFDFILCNSDFDLILYCTTTYYYVLFHWRCMYV